MGLFSGFFGGSNSRSPTQPLDFEIQQDWFLGDAELKKLSDYLSNHPSIHLTQSHDAMDDFNVLTLSLAASQFECADLDVAPTLMFRARKKGLSVTVEPFIHFQEKFFTSRGKNPNVRLRFDEDEPIVCEDEDTSYSTNKSSLFFGRLEPFQKIITSNQMRVQIIPERGNTVLAMFDFAPARPALKIFGETIFGPDFQSIMTTNPQIMDHLLRTGPKNTLTYKKALTALRFDPGPMDYTKGAAFYEAVQNYAIACHASEIFGVFEGVDYAKRQTPNMPWWSCLYKEMPSRIRMERASLKIFD
jgi:hypothetical protein